MIKPGLYLILLFNIIFVSAQNSKTDTAAKREELLAKAKKSSNTEKEVIYLELAKLYIPDSLQTAVKYLNKALQYKEGKPEYKVYLTFADIYLQKRQTDSAKIYLDKGIKTAEKHKNYDALGKLFYKKGDITYYGNDYKTADIFYQKAFDFAKKANNPQLQADILIDRAYIFEYWAKREEALKLLQQAMETSDSSNYIKGKARASLVIGNIYHGMNKFDKALEYYKKTLKNANLIQNRKGIGIAYGNIGMAYLEMHRDALAIKNLLMSNKIMYELKDYMTLANNYMDLAIIYARKGNSEKSLYYADKGIELMRNHGTKEGLLKTLNSKAICLSHLKRYELSNQYLDSCIRLSKESDFGLMLQKSLEAYSNNLKKLGKYRGALKYLQMHNTVKDSIMNDNFQKRLARFEAKYKTLEKQKEIETLQHKQKLQKAHIKFIIVIGFSMVILILVIGYFWVQKHKKEKEISKLQLEKSRMEAQQLTDQVELKNKQLTSHALNMMQKNQLLQSFSENLNFILDKKGENIQTGLKKLNSEINRVINSEKDWDTFKVYFEQVNKDFITNFKKLSDDLTTTDVRLATLIKLNMTNKEIASLLNITHQSVKNAQYRLKNKLGLTAEQDLKKFIWELR